MNRRRFALIALLTPVPHAAAAAGTLDVTGVWSRPAADTGVVYLTVANHGTEPDRLIAASSPVARHAELHESTAGRMSGMSMESMHPVAAIPVPAGGRAVLRPGGYHVMLIGLRHDLRAGTSFPIRLRFARAGWMTVQSTVRS